MAFTRNRRSSRGGTRRRRRTMRGGSFLDRIQTLITGKKKSLPTHAAPHAAAPHAAAPHAAAPHMGAPRAAAPVMSTSKSVYKQPLPSHMTSSKQKTFGGKRRKHHKKISKKNRKNSRKHR